MVRARAFILEGQINAYTDKLLHPDTIGQFKETSMKFSESLLKDFQSKIQKNPVEKQ